MNEYDNKYGFNLNSKEEFLLYRCLKNRLLLDSMIDCYFSVSLYGKQEIKNINEYKKFDINIDNEKIEFITHNSYKRGYLQYFTYNNIIGNKYILKLYLPVDAILDGEIFYTTTKTERRKIKINNIIKKYKNEKTK